MGGYYGPLEQLEPGIMMLSSQPQAGVLRMSLAHLGPLRFRLCREVFHVWAAISDPNASGVDMSSLNLVCPLGTHLGIRRT